MLACVRGLTSQLGVIVIRVIDVVKMLGKELELELELSDASSFNRQYSYLAIPNWGGTLRSFCVDHFSRHDTLGAKQQLPTVVSLPSSSEICEAPRYTVAVSNHGVVTTTQSKYRYPCVHAWFCLVV